VKRLVQRIGHAAMLGVDPETAHGLSLAALKAGLGGRAHIAPDQRLRTRLASLYLSNPLGMAAGYDKNAEVPDALFGIGFGFVEVGSITPRPQPGNPKPRIFRIAEDEAVINRLGFNNEGHAAALARLRRRSAGDGILGVNVGANKDSADRAGDYVAGVQAFAGFADYLAVNISSPNTPGLRNLQARGELADLLGRLTEARGNMASPRERSVPLLLKIAPDLQQADLEDIAAEVTASGIDGVIVSNTTLERPGATAGRTNAREAGGLSGRPLFARSTKVLARMRRLLGTDMTIVGVGGVDSAETALEKVRAGADAVQLYTGLIYGGPGLPARIVRDLGALLDAAGAPSLGALRDAHVARWADAEL
jgi:dihydroorotate dehydrogenase